MINHNRKKKKSRKIFGKTTILLYNINDKPNW